MSPPPPGGATGRTGRRLRRASHAPRPERRVGRQRRPPAASPREARLTAGLLACALGLGLGGVTVVLDAPDHDRATTSAAFRTAPLRTAAAALTGELVTPAVTPPTAPPPPGAAEVDGGPTTDGRATGFSPRTLSIPSLELLTGVGSTGMTEDRNLEVPADASRVGWYRGFAEPGDPGVSVLLGHVDSRDGPGVFFRLPELEAGERIEVERSDGRVVAYEVERVEWFDKHDFPTEQVYTSSRDQVLRLITCGGTFDPARRTYLENVVVTAVPIVGAADAADVQQAVPEAR